MGAEAPTAGALGDALAGEVASIAPAPGGDVNRALRVTLADGRAAFVKYRADADPDMYRAEADGLRWLAAAGALATPAVLARAPGPPPFLALAWIDAGRSTPAGQEALGRGLAALHRAGAPAFGGVADNWIGPLAQANGDRDRWPDFYAARRLLPMAARARDSGALAPADVRAIERLCSRLDELCGPAEPPARLHGDLWAGNAMFDRTGAPVLVDPAAYGGHREVDLAMMRLFGGFAERCFAAYAEAHPLAPGHAERVPLCQLYPLLVHAALFGAGYAGAVRRAVAAYA